MILNLVQMTAALARKKVVSCEKWPENLRVFFQIIQIAGINSARVMAINLGEKERIYHETMQSPIKIMLALDLISDRGLKQQQVAT